MGGRYRILARSTDLRQRAAALRERVARRTRPAPAMPTPAAVAAAIELHTLSVPELTALYDVAALVSEVCGAITCQPRSIERGPDGAEQPSPAGRLAVWQMSLCTSLLDRVTDRLEEVGAPGHPDRLERHLVDVVESMPPRL